jgi:hypothetical protein
LERVLILMIKKEKALEIGEIHLKTHLNTFVSNMFLTLKVMNFKNVSLTKSSSFLCYSKHV